MSETIFSKDSRLLIFGAGAVGSLLGARLRHGGARVSLLGRKPHMEAIHQGGLSLRDDSKAWGDAHVDGFEELATAASELPKGAFDLIILTTRTTETEEATRAALPLLKESGFLLSVQNGLGNWETMARLAGWGRVIGGVINTGVEVSAPASVRVTVQGFPMMIGRPPHPEAPPEAVPKALVDFFAALGLPVQSEPDIRARQWRKLMYNVALNAPAALRDGTYRVLLDNEIARAEQEALIAECYAVANAHGIRLDPPTIDAFNQWFFGDVFPRTADHEPSMLAHLKAGKLTEIDAINGAISRLGKEKGIPTPMNDFYTAKVHELESSSQ